MRFLILGIYLLLILPGSIRAQQEFIWGVNGHPFAQEGYRPDTYGVPYDEQLNQIAALHMNYYRADIALNNTTRANWLDQLLTKAASRNIRILPIIFPNVDWYGEAAKPQPDLMAIYSTSFQGAYLMADRFRGRISAYELHNELDCFSINPNYWGPGCAPDGDQIAHYLTNRLQISSAMLRGMSDGIKAGDPNAKRVMCPCTWVHTGFLEAMINDGVKFDIIAWHWYSDMGRIDQTLVPSKGVSVINYLSQYGKPIWITEGNLRQALDDAHMTEGCNYLRNTIQQMYGLRNLGLQGYFIYELLDEPYFLSEEGHFGLIKLIRGANNIGWQIDSLKPAFFTVRETIAPYVLTPGDANGDGVVNVVDLGILATNYGVTGTATWSMGDFNSDTKVDVVDLGVMSTYYGQANGADSTPVAKDVELTNESEVVDKTSAEITCPIAGLPIISCLLLAGLSLLTSSKLKVMEIS